MNGRNEDHALPKWALALIQSTLIALFLLLAYLGIYFLHEPIIVSCLAASAFIAFGFPTANAAKPRILLGGYICGAAGGLLCSFILHGVLQTAPGTHIPSLLLCALAAFLTSFFMIFLEVQHPPAAAFAVGVALDENPLPMVLIAIGSIMILCVLQWLKIKFLGKYLPAPKDGT